MAGTSQPVLRVEDLRVDVVQPGRRARTGDVVQILKGISLHLNKGAMMGLLGESGSGKSMTARAIMRQLPPNVVLTGGRIFLSEEDLAERTAKEMRAIRGTEIGMIFQNPHRALHPMLSVERQMGEVAKVHRGVSGAAARDLICEYLDLCGISDPRRVAGAYPHELSGGMAQRVVSATPLLPQPRVLIADEPTTGLDATIQRRVLALLRDLQQRLDLSVLFVTHDLGIVAHFCDWAVVMREGELVEEGTPEQVLLAPSTEYSQELVASARLDELDEPRLSSSG